MKNTTVLGAMFLGAVLVAGFLLMGSGGAEITGNAIAAENIGSGELQKVVIGMKDYNYYPQEVRVKANQPVSISLEDEVYGCFRSFTIRDLGVSKYLQGSKDTLEFTPTTPGKYTFACSMGMGTGTLIVE